VRVFLRIDEVDLMRLLCVVLATTLLFRGRHTIEYPFQVPLLITSPTAPRALFHLSKYQTKSPVLTLPVLTKAHPFFASTPPSYQIKKLTKLHTTFAVVCRAAIKIFTPQRSRHDIQRLL
jgi:hypothetical protein